MKFKRHKTVDELLATSLPESDKTIDAMNRMFNEDAVSQYLFILRTRAGVSQAEMAKRLHVSQSVVSKMENHGNYLKFNDVVRYIGALGFSAEFGCVKGGRPIDFLGSYFSRITKIMGDLRELAGDDPDITTGIMTTFLAFSNSMLENVIPQLKNKLPRRHTQLEFSYSPEERESKVAAPVKGRKSKHANAAG